METTLSHKIRVGLFMGLGLLVTMVSIFMLGANRTIFATHDRIYADFENTQGLARGSVVSLAGVVIGNVEKITFVKGADLLHVAMKIDSDFMERVYEGSEVEIRTQGALGDKYIFIIPGNPKNPPVKSGALLPVAKATDLINILSERGKDSVRIFDIMEEVHKTMLTINQNDNIGQTLTNLRQATTAFKEGAQDAAKMSSELRQANISQKTDKALQSLDSILNKLDKGQGTLGALINDPSLHEQLKAFVGSNPRKDHFRSILKTTLEKVDENQGK